MPVYRIKNIKFIIILVLLFILVGCAKKRSNVETVENMNLSIYPNPQMVEVKDTLFSLGEKVGIVSSNIDVSTINILKDLLKQNGVKSFVDYTPKNNIKTEVTVYLLQDKDDDFTTSTLKSINASSSKSLPSEGYLLVSGHTKNLLKKIVIVGADQAGIFYGVQTLRQVIEQTSEGRVRELFIHDYPEMPIRGVIEGFYGEPWTQEDRVSQLQFYGKHKMNTYMYAPKDDPYHRDKWRESYPEEELDELIMLINEAKANHVRFVFTISPGLDICYASDTDFNYLISKVELLWYLGVRDFAILLDDIHQRLHCSKDEAMFGGNKSPFASAQSYLLNRFQTEFIDTHSGAGRLITVPTEYHQAETSIYREEFGKLVDPRIIVQWTGIGITTDTITDDDALKISDIFKHDLLIWDNHPVTDFAKERLFLTPLMGRSSKLASNGVIGITANPMEHAEASKISLFTVADYAWNPNAYDYSKSWEASLKDFGGSFYEDIKRFSENTFSSELTNDESLIIKPLIEEFFETQDNNQTQEVGNKLLAEFKNLVSSADNLENNFTNRAFIDEVKPWLTKMRYYGVTGELATKMLLAQLDNDKEQVIAIRDELDIALTKDTIEVNYPTDLVASRGLNGINSVRGEQHLIQYTPSFGPTTKTNEWGTEITVIDGVVTSFQKNNSVIPANGYVLSLHLGGDGEWLTKNAIVGAKVVIKNNIVTITIEKGVEDVVNAKVYAKGVIGPFIEQAKRINDVWLGIEEESGPFTSIEGVFKNYVLENIFDQNLDTLYWAPIAPKQGDYIGVDLGQEKPINTIELYMASTTGIDARPLDFIKKGAIEVSTNGLVWINLYEFENQTEVKLSDLSINARYIRCRVLATQSDWAQIREFIIR